jgi:hypothetical protein
MGDEKKIQEIKLWVEKLRKLLALGNKKSIAEDMPGLQKELQALAGEGALGEALGPQLQLVLGQLAEGLETQTDLGAELSSDEEQLQQMVEDFRPEVEDLLLEIDRDLSDQELAMFEMTREIIANNCKLRQFENALQLLQQTWHKASEIKKEAREPVRPPMPAIDLAPLVQSAAKAVGEQMSAWTPFLDTDDRVQFALFASMLNRCLQEGAQGPALGLLGAWSEAMAQLPGPIRERILMEVEAFAPPEQANPSESKPVRLACEKVRSLLSGGKTEIKDIQLAQQQLDLLPSLVKSAEEAIHERKRCEAQWASDLKAAVQAINKAMAEFAKELRPAIVKQVRLSEAWKNYGEISAEKVDGNQEGLSRRLAEASRALCLLVDSIGTTVTQQHEREQEASRKKEKEEEENAPQEIDAIDELLRACQPFEKEDITSYMQRDDVTDFLGVNWLSIDAYGRLATTLSPKTTTHKSGGSNNNNDEDETLTGAWNVTGDDPRVYFTEKAALDKAIRIIKATKSGTDPRKAATDEGCSTPTWYGDMLEIRLTQGGTQLRLIAYNRGNGQLEFAEIKSFHSAGDKKAGKLSQYE